MDDTDDDPPELYCRHLLICQTIWYDPENFDSGHSAGRLVVHIRPPKDYGYPFTVAKLFALVQLFGTPGEYTVRIPMTRIVVSDDGDEIEEPVTEFGPWDVLVTGDAFVETFGLALIRVPFREVGVYEFQVWVDGFDAPLARERLQARE